MTPVRRLLLLALLVVGAWPSAALALPGDPPIEPLTPADGATLPVSEAGFAASYQCPVYRTFSAGEGFDLFGGPKDYAIGVATSPNVDPDGRLAAASRVSINGGTDIGWSQSGTVCSGPVAASGSPAQRFQEIPGTYYWQVWRICTGCAGSYEVGPIRRLELVSTAKPVIGAAKTAYAGYPTLVPVDLPGVLTGTTVAVERRVAGTWRPIGSAAAVGEAATIATTFAKAGTETLRVTVTIGSQTLVSPQTTLKVKKASSPRTTSRRDDGRYRDTGRGIESLDLRATVKQQGREISGLEAKVPATCPNVTPGTFTTQILTATFPKLRIAPDGRFVGARTSEGGAFSITGRIKGRKLTEGRITASLGPCVGDRTFSGKRT